MCGYVHFTSNEVTYLDAVLYKRFGVVKPLKYHLSSRHSNLNKMIELR